MSARLFIAGDEVELRQSTELALTRQVATAIDLDKRQLDFSNRVSIPATPSNIELMEMLGVNGNSSSRPYKLADARLEVDGVTYADKLKAMVDGLGPEGYEIRLIADPFDFIQQMKGKQMRDIVDTYVNGGVHSLNTTTWKIFQAASGGFTYPLISQLRPFPQFPRNRLYIDLSYPAFFTRDLLIPILEQYFTEVRGSFLSSPTWNNDLTFAANVESDLWKEWERGRASLFSPINYNGSLTLFDWFTLSIDKNDKGALGNTLISMTPVFRYRAPASRYFTIKIAYNVSGSFADGLKIQLRKKPSSQLDPNVSDPVIAETDLISSSINAEGEFTGYVNKDDDLYFSLRITGLTPYNFTLNQFDFDIQPLRQGIFGDDTMNPKLLLPSVTEWEYFQDQVKRFGLIWRIEDDGAIRFESFSDVTSGKFGNVDWTQKINRFEKTSYSNGSYGRRNYLQYKGDRGNLLFEDYNGWAFFDFDNDNYEPEKVTIESIGTAVTQAIERFLPPNSNALNVGNFEVVQPNNVVLLQDVSTLVYGRLAQTDQFSGSYTLFTARDGNTGQVQQPFEFTANVGIAELFQNLNEFYGNILLSLDRPVVRDMVMYFSETDFYNLDFFKLIYLEQFQKFHYLLGVENYIPGNPCKVKMLEVVGDVQRICTYRVEGAFPFGYVCLDVFAETFNLIEFNEFEIGVENSSTSEIPIYFSCEPSDFPITREQIFQGLVASFNSYGGKFSLFVSENKICLVRNYADLEGENTYTFSAATDETDQNDCEVFLFTGLFDDTDLICDPNTYEYTNSSFLQGTFQVFRNGVWTTETPVGGVYESSDPFTAWRIIDDLNNVIDSGTPQLICE